MKRTALLRESLPAICRAITRQKGIKLVFQGPPRTDGKTIYSNPLPIDADEDQVKMIVGDIDHECGHVLFSDFDAREREIEQVAPERRPLLHAIGNAIEDTMVERRTGEEYLGCRVTLAESAELLEASIEERVVPDDPGRLLANFIDCWGRVNVLEQRVEKSLGATVEAVDDLIGVKGRQKLEALLRQHLFSVSSTAETLTLARRVERFLDELEEDEDEPEEADQQDDEEPELPEEPDEAPKPSNGDDDASAPQDGQGQSSAGDSADDGADADGTGAGSGTPNAGAQEILQSNPDPTPLFDRREQADQAIEEASEEHYVPEGPDGGLGDADGQDLVGGTGGRLRIIPRPGAYERLKLSISGQVQRLTRQIVQEYQTRTRRRWLSSEEGRLDARRLVQAHMGHPRVYRRRQQQMIPFPAVGLVVDGSSSMYGRDMELALQAAAVLAETNQLLNVRTGIHVFAGDQVQQIKGYDQPLVQVQDYLAGVQPSGGTPMGDALWAAGCALARQREKRKLLFLITDGAPNDAQATIEIAQMLIRSGIEVYGVGIGSEAVERFCSHAAVVNDAGDVAGAILSALRQSITKAA